MRDICIGVKPVDRETFSDESVLRNSSRFCKIIEQIRVIPRLTVHGCCSKSADLLKNFRKGRSIVEHVIAKAILIFLNKKLN